MNSHEISFVLFFFVMIAGCAGSLTVPAKPENRCTPIVLVAFGSTRPDTQATFDNIESAYRQAFPNREIRWAFTSRIVRARLLTKGIEVMSPRETAHVLREEGYTDALFQSLHVAPGQEFMEIRELEVPGFQLHIGDALLTTKQDISTVAKLLAAAVDTKDVAVFAAHGNEAHPEFNKELIALKSELENRKQNGFLCSVEGNPPGTDGIEYARRLAARSGRVTFVPVMIVSGVHIRDDVMGEDPKSWRQQISAADTRLAPPLGDKTEIVNIFIQHSRDALANLESTTGRQRGKQTTGWAFVASKANVLLKLGLYIMAGVLVANVLELLGVVRFFSFITWPITRLGRIHHSAGPAFLMAFQSGAMANSILVTNRDNGVMDNRQLYTSVLVVSCLSLFAHLPTYVLPIGSVLGPKAATALFATRFAAIAIEIIVILILGSLIVKLLQKRMELVPESALSEASSGKLKVKENDTTSPFFKQVWYRSRKTLLRLLIYVVPTFVVLGAIEYFGFFTYLSRRVPGLYSLDFLPPESAVVIPAQALSLYNGAIAAAGFVDSNALAVKQAVLIILVGSIITAPIRTLKHAIPTYVAILGGKAGTVLAISAQVLRSIFLVFATIGLWFVW